jgi:hypothetical protein
VAKYEGSGFINQNINCTDGKLWYERQDGSKNNFYKLKYYGSFKNGKKSGFGTDFLIMNQEMSKNMKVNFMTINVMEKANYLIPMV